MQTKKNNPRLVPVHKTVTRKGKTFVQVFYVDPEDKRNMRRKQKSTEDLYKKDGKWTPKREKLHNAIVSKTIDSCPKAAPGERPEVILLLGGAAAGKTTVVKKFLEPKYGKNFGTINADDIKDQIPEFNDYKNEDVKTAAGRVHRESSDMSKVAVATVIEEKRNFIFDGTLSKLDRTLSMVDELTKQGYKVRLVGVTVDPEEAADRAIKRGLGEDGKDDGSGRYVDERTTMGGHIGSTIVYEHLKNDSRLESHELYDNNSSYDIPPEKIVDNGTVINKDLYNRFQSKMSFDIEKTMAKRKKNSLNKAFESLDMKKSISTPINSDRTNLSVSSEDYRGSDIHKSLYNDNLQKDLKKAELGEKPVEEKKEPSIEEAHAEEMRRKELDREHSLKMDKKYSYDSLSKEEQRALRVLVNIDGKSAKEKIEGVMQQYHVSKMGAINILADATKHKENEESKKTSKDESKEHSGTHAKLKEDAKDGKLDTSKKELGSMIDKDHKKKGLQKAFDVTLEKGKKPLDPNGRWVTIDGRHVHINAAGNVDAGKIYGKDEKGSKDHTTKNGGKDQGKGGWSEERAAAFRKKTKEHNKQFNDLGQRIKAKNKETGVKFVDEVLSRHSADKSETPAIALLTLRSAKKKLTKRLDKLGSSESNPSNRAEMKKLGNALGEVNTNISKHEKTLSDRQAGKAIPSIDSFKKLAGESNNLEDFVAKVRQVKNVPDHVAKEFKDKYGKGNASIMTAAKNFMDEHGKGAESKGDLKAQIKAAKKEHESTSFADPKKNETHAKLRELQAQAKGSKKNAKIGTPMGSTSVDSLTDSDKPITERDVNPDRYKTPEHEKTKEYKEMKAKNPKGNIQIDTAHKATKINQSKMSPADKKSMQSALDEVNWQLADNGYIDPNEKYSDGSDLYNEEEKQEVKTFNDWSKKHGIDKGKGVTIEAFRDGLSNGVMDAYVHDHTVESIVDSFSKMLDKYPPENIDPNQTRLFKARINDIFGKLGMNKN